MDGFVEGAIAPRHSERQARGRQDIQDQSAIGNPDTHDQQGWNTEMELVRSAVQLDSIRPALRESRVSHCLGLCLHQRIPQGVGCGTYKFFKRSRQKLTQLAQELSQSWHSVRSAANKRGTETKKVLKTKRAMEEESVLLVWQAYCRGDEGTRTWCAR